ncbi:hypothetical protein CLOP_g12967 [Closterium sp. NIES-67]|nr:hypothetical protein CLOP_g12967 [Closterium sp. NIES-67]
MAAPPRSCHLSISVDTSSAADAGPSSRSVPVSRSSSTTSASNGSSGSATPTTTTSNTSSSTSSSARSDSCRSPRSRAADGPSSLRLEGEIRSKGGVKDAPFLVISRREALFGLLPLATVLSLVLLASAVRQSGSRTNVSSPEVRGATGLRQLLGAPYDYRDDLASSTQRLDDSPALIAGSRSDEYNREGDGDTASAGTDAPSRAWAVPVTDTAEDESLQSLGSSVAVSEHNRPDASTNDAALAAVGGSTSSSPMPRGGGGRDCKRRTRTGHCLSELFSVYDDAYRSLWPSRVDLVIRSHVSSTFFLLEMLFASIEQMWPRGIGDVILILDSDERLAEDLIPTWIKVYYEHNPLKLPGKILQQWSYLWADNYTTAPYVALIDDDVIFNMKVTPRLLFNLTDGKPYVIGSKQKQMNHWLPSTQFFVGEDKYFANFMVQLPFVMPTSVLPRFRSHVANLHKDKGGSFDSAFEWFSVHGPKFEKTQIAHTTIGNYMWAYAHDEVHWALEWTNHTPIPRVGVHVPYSQPFRVATKHRDDAPRVIKTYVQLAAYYSHEGVCHAVPAGELPGCDDVSKYSQRQIWQYAMDWFDWPAIKEKRANATVVYDQYVTELACMYWRVAQGGGGGGGGGESSMQGTAVEMRGDVPAERRRELVSSLQDCVTPRS